MKIRLSWQSGRDFLDASGITGWRADAFRASELRQFAMCRAF
jgi:hypothetical protein